MPKTYGVEAGNKVVKTTGLPRLRVKATEMADFHILSSGSDPLFHASRFHSFGSFKEKNLREYVCTRELTGGEEECKYCAEGHASNLSKFALWVWCYNVYHASDNPDPEGPRWKARKVGTKPAEGQPDNRRTLFQEEIGRPLLLELKMGGRGQPWYSMFTREWTTYGTFQKYRYRLEHEFAGDQVQFPHNYVLKQVKEETIPESILADEQVKSLPAIEDIWRTGLSYGAGASSPSEKPLGEDGLDGDGGGGEDEPLPSAVSANGTDDSSDDDLI